MQEIDVHIFYLGKKNVVLDQKDLAHQGIFSQSLSAFERLWRQELEPIRITRGYIGMDEVRLDSRTPNLDILLKEYFQEHCHEAEEIRFVTHGTGVFDVRNLHNQWIRIYVAPGDLLVIPAQRFHRFTLDANQFIVMKRLYKSMDGWDPIIRETLN